MVTLSDFDFDLPSGVDSRLELLEQHDIPKAAIRRFLAPRGIKVDVDPDRFKRAALDELSKDQFSDLMAEFRYAGPGAVNYFELSGLETESLKSIERIIKEHFSQADDDDLPYGLYVANTEKRDEKLFISFGYINEVSYTDPKTRIKKQAEVPESVTVVVHRNEDIYEVRESDNTIIKSLTTEIRDAFGQKDAMSGRVEFGEYIRSDIEDQYVDRFSSVKMRLRKNDEETVRTVSATSGKDNGDRLDVRDDQEYESLVENRGGEVIMGYATLNGDGFEEELRLHLNWDDHRISFQQFQTESNYKEVSDKIYELVRENRGSTREGSEKLRRFT